MSAIFENSSEDSKKEKLLQNKTPKKSKDQIASDRELQQDKQKYLMTVSVSEDYSINDTQRKEDEDEVDDPRRNNQPLIVNSYREPDHEAVLSHVDRNHDFGAHTEAERKLHTNISYLYS